MAAGEPVRAVTISTCAVLFALPLAAAAQDHDGTAATISPPLDTQEAIARARQVYSVRPPRPEPCPPEREGEIVVCRRLEDPETLRVESATDAAIAAGKAVPDGLPRAPDVFGLPSCEVVKCMGFGSVPPAPLIIDLKAIPEPPPGSDAAGYGYQAPPEERPAEP